MKRLFGKSLALLLAVLCTVMLMAPALAAESDSETTETTETTYTATPTATVPVDVTVKGTDIPEGGETFTIVLRATTDGAPMPDGATGSKYTFEVGPVLSGASGEFSITYNKVGDYEYIVSERAGDNENCTYSDEVYTLLVQVRNVVDADGNYVRTADGKIALTIYWVLNPDSEEGKPDDILFENVYEEPDEPDDDPDEPDDPTPPSETTTPDPDEPEPSVTGDEYDDPTDPTEPDEPEPVTPDEPDSVDITEDEVPLDDAEAPAEEPTVEIEDEGVPQGDVTIEDEGVPQGGVTIDDEGVPLGSLPQTGQLWWPVLLMLCLGVALLVGAGFDMHMTKRNSEK